MQVNNSGNAETCCNPRGISAGACRKIKTATQQSHSMAPVALSIADVLNLYQAGMK